MDGVHNGDETDIDCGRDCQPCDVGQACRVGSDCVHGVCDEAVCLAAQCGDGVLNGTEGCDDGNTNGNDACTSDCVTAQCGDGFVFAGREDCDDGGETLECDVDCTITECGDAIVNRAAGEACDAGGESAACNENCTVAICGDRIVNRAAGEMCVMVVIVAIPIAK